MVRTVVAFAGAKTGDTICEMLEKGGVTVRSRCRTGAEVMRSIKRMGGGVVVCQFRLRDMTADDLYHELKDIALFLIVDRPTELELCEGEDFFRLPAPVRGGELCGSVRMLSQLDEQRFRAAVPKRSKGDAELIERAKAHICEKNGVTEEEAHRFLQRRSMETGTPMADIARMVLEALD